jgi:nicotinate-nucleotide adenylyltransferase
LRIGVLGGTFDPIHYGHLRMAEEAREQLSLDRVIFVPNRVSPFKVGLSATPWDVRAEMARQAIAGDSRFSVSMLELNRPGPSYSVDTLRALRAEEPAAEWYFLTGADAVRDLAGWREPEALLEMATLVAFGRPGVTLRDIDAALPERLRSRVVFRTMPLLDISATDLRGRVAAGKSIRFLTPPAVERIICECGLYRNDEAGAAVNTLEKLSSA